MMKAISLAFHFLCLGTVLFSCSEPKPAIEQTPSVLEPRLLSCSNKAICTQVQTEVCGQIDNGLRCFAPPCPSWNWETYPSACDYCQQQQAGLFYNTNCSEVSTHLLIKNEKAKLTQ